MIEKKMLVQYIRKGFKGRRLVKDGVEFIQPHRGPRIGVMVALSKTQFGWSLVHMKGENREAQKDVSWKKGVEIAVARAEGITSERVPDSIQKDFKKFCEKAAEYFSDSEAQA